MVGTRRNVGRVGQVIAGREVDLDHVVPDDAAGNLHQARRDGVDDRVAARLRVGLNDAAVARIGGVADDLDPVGVGEQVHRGVTVHELAGRGPVGHEPGNRLDVGPLPDERVAVLLVRHFLEQDAVTGVARVAALRHQERGAGAGRSGVLDGTEPFDGDEEFAREQFADGVGLDRRVVPALDAARPEVLVSVGQRRRQVDVQIVLDAHIDEARRGTRGREAVHIADGVRLPDRVDLAREEARVGREVGKRSLVRAEVDAVDRFGGVNVRDGRETGEYAFEFDEVAAGERALIGDAAEQIHAVVAVGLRQRVEGGHAAGRVERADAHVHEADVFRGRRQHAHLGRGDDRAGEERIELGNPVAELHVVIIRRVHSVDRVDKSLGDREIADNAGLFEPENPSEIGIDVDQVEVDVLVAVVETGGVDRGQVVPQDDVNEPERGARRHGDEDLRRRDGHGDVGIVGREVGPEIDGIRGLRGGEFGRAGGVPETAVQHGGVHAGQGAAGRTHRVDGHAVVEAADTRQRAQAVAHGGIGVARGLGSGDVGRAASDSQQRQHRRRGGLRQCSLRSVLHRTSSRAAIPPEVIARKSCGRSSRPSRGIPYRRAS